MTGEKRKIGSPDDIGTDANFREFACIVRPGGRVVPTQRGDLFVERDCDEVIQNLEHEGAWEKVLVSKPKPCLHGNKEYAERYNVI